MSQDMELLSRTGLINTLLKPYIALPSRKILSVSAVTRIAKLTPRTPPLRYYAIHLAYHFLPFWLTNKPATISPRITDFIKQLRAAIPQLPIGAIGFCWGGRHAVLLSQPRPEMEKPVIQAAFTGHPAEIAIPGEVEGVCVPLSIAIGTQDSLLSQQGIEDIREVLGRKGDGLDWEVTTYEGAKHGFATRQNPEDSRQMEQADEAETQAVRWLEKHFESFKPEHAG